MNEIEKILTLVQNGQYGVYEAGIEINLIMQDMYWKGHRDALREYHENAGDK